ncbi:hypothetical protein K523DRAFT_388605 [Schizophyllum commune Tattone D]|nr:hypothetical protein K523DRAFT_388605 [Schizophyllum commune Tattone D]
MGIPGAKTASKEFRASIKEAIRLIKAGGLQRLLDAPPDKPLADFLGSLGCNEVCTQLYTLAMLADIVRRGHPALWVLPDPMDLYPRVFRWIAYLLPLKRGFSMEYRSVNRDIMLELLDGSIGIFQHVLSLPLDRARSTLLSEGHDAISDIVTIWLHWPEILAATKTKKDEERRSCCIQLPQSLWKALGQTDDDNALIATFFLRSVSHKPTRLFKFIERQLHEANLRLARDDDTAWADATSFVIISTLLLLYRDLGMRLVPGGMVYSMTIFTRLAAAKRPHLSEICLKLLNILCANESRALSTALTCGIFSLLAQLHAAHLCHEDSLTELRGLISGALSFPKSVELFSAHAAMSDLVRQSWVLPEENELRELAERRKALLQVASQD